MTFTAETIRAAALAYNAAYPEAAAEIETGRPVVDVAAKYADKTGRRFTFVIEPGIRCADGGFIGAGLGYFETHRSLDGRLGRTEQARRRYRHLLAGPVAVEIREAGF